MTTSDEKIKVEVSLKDCEDNTFDISLEKEGVVTHQTNMKLPHLLIHALNTRKMTTMCQKMFEAFQIGRDNTPLSWKPVNVYKRFLETFGLPPKAFKGILYSIVRERFIDNTETFPNREKYVNSLCRRHRGNYDVYKLLRLNEMKYAVTSLERDGLQNVIPLLLLENVSECRDVELYPTKVMKQALGKSLWKTLVKQSFTRNGLVLDYIQESTHNDVIKFLVQKVPSTLLKYGHRQTCSLGFLKAGSIFVFLNIEIERTGFTRDKIEADFLDNFLKFVKQYPISTQTGLAEFHRGFRMVLDTISAYRNGNLDVGNREVNIKWNSDFNYILQHHGLIRHRHYDVRYKDETPVDFSWLSFYEDASEYLHQKWDAEVLLTEDAIVKEGDMMGHCVSMYARSVGQEKYLVIHVGDGAKGYTIGCNRDKAGGLLTLQQAYGYENRILTKAEDKVVNRVIMYLNQYTRSKKEVGMKEAA